MSEPPEDPTAPGFNELGALERMRTATPSGARRVPPNPNKPRVSAKKERVLEQVHAEAAAGYDELDQAGETIVALTKAIEDGVVQAPLEIDDSLVIKLTKLVGPEGGG